MLLFTRHNELIKDDVDTSALSLIRSIYVLLMTSQSIADGVTRTLPEGTALEKRYLTEYIDIAFVYNHVNDRSCTNTISSWMP